MPPMHQSNGTPAELDRRFSQLPLISGVAAKQRSGRPVLTLGLTTVSL